MGDYPRLGVAKSKGKWIFILIESSTLLTKRLLQFTFPSPFSGVPAGIKLFGVHLTAEHEVAFHCYLSLYFPNL